VLAIRSATVTQPQTGAAAPFEQCEQCGAPVERTQRYCVACGAHRRHVHDPAARHLANVASRSRALGSRPGRQRKSPSAGLGTVLVLAVIPLAVGLGVLLGRAATNGDQQLIAALRAQKPEIITTGGDGAGPPATPVAARPAQNVTSLSSDFPLSRGFAVELQTLPASGTEQAAVSQAEHAAKAKGAESVGLIVQRDFRVTPSPPAGSYVIYSGAYRTRAAATKALAKLAKTFPPAKVIQVQPASAAGMSGSGRVLATSVYGSAHQIAGSKPTASQLAAGRQAVARIQKQSGKSYVNSQRGLPDQIAVP
jgi:hypothetical protein